MNSIDVMLDLETTGVSAGCAILSIGATTLDLSEKFYSKVSKESCERAKLVDNQETMAWWSKQDPQARAEAFSGTASLVEVLGQFADYMNLLERKFPKKVFVWGNGADFDLPILEAAYLAVGMEKPWHPTNGRCYRTIKNLPQYHSIKKGEFKGLKHHALDDAVSQAIHLMQILKYEKGRGSAEQYTGNERRGYDI